VPFYTSRINPAFAQLLTYETVTNSWYHAGTLEVNKRFSHGLQFMSSFTWSHATDDGQASFTFLPLNSAVFDSNNRRADYGNSIFDQRRRFVFSGVWQPQAKSGAGIGHAVASGWTRS